MRAGVTRPPWSPSPSPQPSTSPSPPPSTPHRRPPPLTFSFSFASALCAALASACAAADVPSISSPSPPRTLIAAKRAGRVPAGVVDGRDGVGDWAACGEGKDTGGMEVAGGEREVQRDAGAGEGRGGGPVECRVGVRSDVVRCTAEGCVCARRPPCKRPVSSQRFLDSPPVPAAPPPGAGRAGPPATAATASRGRPGVARGRQRRRQSSRPPSLRSSAPGAAAGRSLPPPLLPSLLPLLPAALRCPLLHRPPLPLGLPSLTRSCCPVPPAPAGQASIVS